MIDRKLFLLAILILSLATLFSGMEISSSTSYLVMKNGSGNYTTIQNCANAATTAGDSCLVFAGYYNETVLITSAGSAGNHISFVAAESGAGVRSFTLRLARYITIQGFEITNNMTDTYGIWLTNTTNVNLLHNTIHHTGNAAINTLRTGSTPNSSSNYTLIRNNTIYFAGVTASAGAVGIDVNGHHNLIEGNDVSHIHDYVRLHGSYNVLRNNTFHDSDNVLDFNAAPDAIHYDGMQTFGQSANPTYHMLVENNRFSNTTEEENNVHFALFQNYNYPAYNTSHAIVRHNVASHVSSLVGADVNFPEVKVYSNTVLHNAVKNSTGHITSYTIVGFNGNSTGGKVINNIFYNTTRNAGEGYSYGTSSNGFNASYNLAYNTLCGSSCVWANPINTEVNVTKNQHPLFVNNLSDYSLQSGSPAVDTGGKLTFIENSDSGNGVGLVVNDSGMFQDGWAGVDADWISVGNTTNIAQIDSINYTNHTITLATPLTRNDGDAVYLYKDSSGRRVLYGDAPDKGAFEFVTASAAPDTTAPSVTLRAPSNATTLSFALVSFNSTFTDDVNLSNATLHVWNSTGQLINSTVQSKTGTSNFSNISFTLPYEGVFRWNFRVYDNSSNNGWASANNTLTYSSGDDSYPIFSSYADNSGDLIDSGTATFNVTIGSTNGTVFLQIGGVNYTATNLSSVGYNVSLSMSSAGTYTYYWHAYGNGSAHNLNSSSGRTYIVDEEEAAASSGGGSGGGGGGGGASTSLLTTSNSSVSVADDANSDIPGSLGDASSPGSSESTENSSNDNGADESVDLEESGIISNFLSKFKSQGRGAIIWSIVGASVILIGAGFVIYNRVMKEILVRRAVRHVDKYISKK